MRTSELAGQRALAARLQVNCFESRSWVAPADGILEIRAMGAGGAGVRRSAVTNTATGGYSGSWGIKRVRVKKGDAVTVSIGAAGATAGAGLPGGNGGNTTITVNGVSYVAYGGPGGLWSSAASIAMPAGPAPSANWDYGAASVRPGMLAGQATGGAGVDIMAKGNDATTSDASAGSGGGGSAFPSVGTRGGGAMPGGEDALGGYPSSAPGGYFDATDGAWGISFYGGGAGTSYGSGAYNGGNGGGGGGTNTGTGGRGGNGGGGGGGGSNTGAGGAGGIGGGGGSGMSNGGAGGPGYACLNFFLDKGV